MALNLLTVLFLADVRINLDEYRNRLVAVCDGKTIITVNPGKQSVEFHNSIFMIVYQRIISL